MKTAKYTVFKDKKGEFRFNLISKNGEVVATGEAYKEKRGAMNAVKKMREWATTEVVEDKTLEVKKPVVKPAAKPAAKKPAAKPAKK